MIKTIQIKNFKSVVDLTLDLGAFNVFIGENGCGKTNILEAISFGAAASADKLDHEFLGSRGIRVTNPEFMFSAFTNGKIEKSIDITFNNVEGNYDYAIINDLKSPKKWIDSLKVLNLKSFFLENNKEALMNFKNSISESQDTKDIDEIIKKINSIKNETDKLDSNDPKKKLISSVFEDVDISNYVIYSPEQSILRKFEETNQIYPLGINGAGLFHYLKELILNKNNAKILNQIKENLLLLDWYEDFELPQNLMSNEYALKIKDRYLHESLKYFDQKSTNEGFLYLLFYFTLFISKDTPRFFALDNIDASLNPKLCMALTRNLAALAKKHKKQAIVTTHNPAILDGLNLKDDNQRLFVIRRNIYGHTVANRVEYKKERTMKLSEIWTSGFIGGLPDNF